MDNTYKYKGFFKRSLSYAPLTLTTLASLVPEYLNAQIDLVDEGIESPDYKNKFYDIVGITSVTSSANRAYQLAEYWRNRGAYVIIGGHHATLMSDEVSKYADTVFCGVAENTFPIFMNDFVSGVQKKIYKDSDYLKESSFYNLPVPKRGLLKKKCYMSIPTVIATRGCSNGCNFCSINEFYKDRPLYRDIDSVIEEIKSLKSKNILFLDPNITYNREYSKKLFEKLIPLKINWGGLATTDICKDRETFDLMVKSGCRGILFGFESLNQANLNNSNKSFNKIIEYKESVDTFHKNNIAVLGCFVLGFDCDTKESLAKLVNDIDDLKIEFPRFAVLTPFPGTDEYKRLDSEKRIISHNRSDYDTEHVVFRPKNMTPNELHNILVKTWRESYNLDRIIKRIPYFNKNLLLGLGISAGMRFYSRSFK